MLGFLPQEELTAELSRAKALVAPSIGMESFGMVLTRAFACAVPVVASDIPGYRAVMTDETGVLVPPGDSDALAEAVVDLLEDEPRRRALGRARAADRDRALLLGPDRRAARADLPRGRGVKCTARIPRSPWTRGGIALAFLAGSARCSGGTARTGASSTTRSPRSSWKWVAAAVGLNLLSVVARAAAWDTVIHSAMPPPHPRFGLVFSAFSVGLLANAVLPGASESSRASPC